MVIMAFSLRQSLVLGCGAIEGEVERSESIPRSNYSLPLLNIFLLLVIRRRAVCLPAGAFSFRDLSRSGRVLTRRKITKTASCGRLQCSATPPNGGRALCCASVVGNVTAVLSLILVLRRYMQSASHATPQCPPSHTSTTNKYAL